MKKLLCFAKKNKRTEKGVDHDLGIPDGDSSGIGGKHVSEVYQELAVEQKPSWTHFGESFPHQGRWQQNKEPKKNKFVINVNNARFFHIGLKKSINIGQTLSVQKCETPPPCDSLLQFKALSKFLDREESLSEVDISLISLHVNDRWKNFLKNLGLQETYLEVLESRSRNNKTLAVYDGLHKYKTLYPNTGISFVINALIQVEEVAIVEKLTSKLELKKTNSML